MDKEEFAKQLVMQGETFYITKQWCKERKDLIYVETEEDIPEFLIEDGAVEIVSANWVVLKANTWSNIVQMPFLMGFGSITVHEPIHDEGAPGNFFTYEYEEEHTLININGRRFNTANIYKCSLVVPGTIPKWVTDAKNPGTLNNTELTAKCTVPFYGFGFHGTIEAEETVKIGEDEAFWIENSLGVIRLLTNDKPHFDEYYIADKQCDGFISLREIYDIIENVKNK